MKISNYYFLSDDTLLFYHNAIDMLLLTDKLNFKCYVLYETKELLTITNMYIIIINILMLIICILLLLIFLCLLSVYYYY